MGKRKLDQKKNPRKKRKRVKERYELLKSDFWLFLDGPTNQRGNPHGNACAGVSTAARRAIRVRRGLPFEGWSSTMSMRPGASPAR